jgi:hypothetical protein
MLSDPGALPHGTLGSSGHTKTWNWPVFKGFERYVRVPTSLPCPVCFPAAAVCYPVGTGKAAILRSIAPKSRLVSWPSASSSQ